MKKHKNFVIEEHVKHGGLSMMIKAFASDIGNKSKIFSYTLKDEFKHFMDHIRNL